MDQDYTRHDEGMYQCRVLSHEVGTKTFGELEQDEFRVKFVIDGRDTDIITAAVRMTNEEKDQKKFFGWLRHLGFNGRISQLDENREAFAGKEIMLECSHWTSPKNGNKNEFWNVPRADALKPINKSRLAAMDSAWKASPADDETSW
jgi:hypothetical protein